jgi:hypothetical protein
MAPHIERKGPNMKISYYAAARNQKDEIEQILVTIENGKSTQQRTGKTYATQRECEFDLTRLNCR